MGRYKIGDVSRISGLSLRTIRYYEEEGLISASRSEGNQRWYTDEDIVYLKRIVELKDLGFSLSEIRGIFELKKIDSTGDLRRRELLTRYTEKLESERKKLEAVQSRVNELEWRVAQLEKAEGSFTSCPGPLCASCEFKDKCIFRKEK